MSEVSKFSGPRIVEGIGDRDQLIDLLRGIVILDMMLVHFSGYFPGLVARLISYTDFAMEGFLFFSGFSVGYHYFPKFIQNRKGASRRFILKAFDIYRVQLFLILTISLPLYYVMYEKIRQSETVWVFLGKSALLVNQIGLIHILPIFIPLFLISPILLYAMEKGMGGWCLGGSILLFLLGNEDPYMFSLGDKTIFPVVLWQIYFVIGCLIGKEAWTRKRNAPAKISSCVVLGLSLFCAAMFIQHAKVIPPAFTSRFPLNVLGFLYGSSMLLVVYLAAARYSKLWRKVRLFNDYIPMLGRHSLMAFVIHVYTAKMLSVANYIWEINAYMNYLCILLSALAIYGVLDFYENNERRGVAYLLLKRIS